MSVFRQVAQNTVLQLLGKVGGTALGFSATLFLLRYLGDEKYGNYTSALAYLQLFGIVMDLGLYVVLLKYINQPEHHNDRFFNNIFTMRVLTAVMFLLFACGLVWFIPNYPVIVQQAVVVVAANFLFITLNQLFLGLYQHHMNMRSIALAEIAGKIVLLMSTVLVIYVWHGGLLVIMGTVVMSGAVNFALLWWRAQRYQAITLAFDWSVWRQVLKDSWPIALAIALNLIYFKADTFILALYHSQADVGIYGAPYKILEVFITIPAMIVGLVLPLLGQAISAKDHPLVKKLYQQTLNGLLILGLPLVVGVWFTAEPLMLLTAGTDFTSQPQVLGQLLRLLMIAVVMIFIGTLTGYMVVIVNRQKQMLWGYGFVAVTALVSYFYFIPRYSYYGAAAVTIYSETLMMLIGLWIVYRATGLLPQLQMVLKILAANAIMGVVVWWFQDWPVLGVIPLAIIIYTLALLLVRAVSRQELQTIIDVRHHVNT